MEYHNLIFDLPSKAEYNIQKLKKTHKKPKKEKDQFEWVQINNDWKNKLLSNDFYTFNCINEKRESITTVLQNSKIIKDTQIKTKIKKYLKEMEFNEFTNILENFNYAQKNNIYIGDLNVSSIKTRNALVKEIIKDTYELQSDNTTLYILSKLFEIDFIILNEETKEIIDTSSSENLKENVIIIHKEVKKSDETFKKYKIKLTGIKKKNKIEFKFKRNDLPDELLDILDRHKFLLKHTKKVFKNFEENNRKITIRELMKEITTNIQENNLSKKDIDDLMVILTNLVNQYLYKERIKS